MEKIFTKSLFFLVFFVLFTSGYASAQTLTIQNFPTGTYSPGSTIAVPFNIGSGGCIQQNNTFQVYLANSAGTIISGPLSTYNGFYATYLNTKIPAGTAPGTYKFVIKSTSPAATSAASPSFTVAAGPVVTAAITSGETLMGTNTFGTCNGTAGLTFDFANSSSTASSTASFFDESTQSAAGIVTLAPNGTFNAAASNYTILVKATNGTTIGTEAYTLVNNKVTNAFALSGTNTVCLGAALTYIIDPNTIKNNYPGITYHIDWGDGTSSDYSYCDLVASGGNVTKFYASGSCSSGNKTFTITDQPKAPYCASLVTPITTAATVLQVPINSFTFSPLGCSNSPITFTNTSDPGQDPTTLNCVNPNARYTWLVDGTAQLSNVPISTLFIYTFTPGSHTVTLHLNSSFTGACPAADVTQNICIQGPPTPAFTLPASPFCLNTPATVTDQSVVDPGCASSNNYLWTVTGPAPVNFTGGTSSSSHQPQLTFSQPGTYTVTLAITAQNCGTYTVSHTIVVDAPPSITMSPNALICGTNLTYSFNPPAGITKTTITGTVTPLAGTYTWTVTGGAFSFAGGTTANSQYPQIKFTGYGTYTVSVTETNSCGTATKSQNLTFQQVPVITIPPVPTICPGSPASLTASISPATYTSVQWSGGTGTFTGSTTLTPSYTPSAAEITAGTVTLTLTVNTGLTGTCSTISQNVVVNIYPTDKITSPTTATICTGNPVNYNITASIAGSTFTWTASNFTGTTTGFTATGSGTPITDVLVNTSATVNSVVSYVITPYDPNGCPGTPLTLKVTVKPHPIITAVAAPAIICGGSTGTINLTTNIAGTTYTWTSSVTGSITGNTQQASAIAATSISSVLNNSGSTPGSVTYTITPYNGTCAGTPVTATITVNPSPVTANAGTNQVICNAASYTLSGNSALPDAGLWTVTSGQLGITFSDPTQANATVSGMVAGQTYKFTWTITPPAPCTPNSSTVTITDAAPSVGGTTAGTATVCSGSSNSNITLSGQVGSILRWESSIDNGTTWLPIANTTTTQPYLNLTQTTQYRAVVQNGICTFAYSTVTTITVNPAAVTANAGTNQVLCNATSYTLGGNNPAPGTGLWTVTSGQAGLTFSNPAQANATVSGMVPGQTYKFTWTITPAAPCTPNSNTVTITDDALSIGGTTAGTATVCSGSSNASITLSGQLGSILRWESSVDNGTTWQSIANTTTTQPYLNLTQTTQYRAVVQNGSCAFAYSTVTTITVNPPAVTANAGTNQVLCNATSYTLNGNNPSPGTGLWTLTSGQTGITFSNPAQANATVSGMVAGQTYQFAWTITPAAPCTPNSSVVTITNDAPSIGGTTAGGNTVCAGSNINGTITLSGQLGAVLRWESSTDNGVTWVAIANTATSQSYINLTQTTQYRAVVKNGVCTFAYSTVSAIVINPAAVQSNAGTTQELCNATTYTLNGNNPSPGTGLWTVTSSQTGVTFSDPTQANATASGLTPGQTYQFTWTITPAAPCAPNSTSVTIVNDAPSIGGTTAGANAFCAGSSNNGTITLSGQLGAVLRWESSVDNGTTWQPIANTSTSLPYTNVTQTTQYRAVVKNGLCTFANSTATTITISQPAVTANAGTNQVLCNATSYVLQGNNPSPGTGIWTVTSSQTGITFSDPTLPTATVSGLTPGQTYQFTWTITPASPCTPNSSSVTIVNDAPSIGGTTSGVNAFCAGSSNNGTITLAGELGAVLRWESSIDNGTTWQPIANTSISQPYANVTQTTQYRAVVKNGVCTFANSTATTITINQPAIPANAGTNQVVCNATTYTLSGNNPSPGTGLWTVTSGQTGITFSDPTQPNATASGMVPGQTYQFTWTISTAAPCLPNLSSVTITDDAPSIGGTTGGGNTFCSGTNASGTITLAGQVGAVLRWESSIDNGTTWQPIANTGTTQQYLNLTQTTQYRAVVKNLTCAFAYSTISSIIIIPPAVQANAGTNQVLCNATTYTLNGNSPSPGTGLWTVTSGQTGIIFSNPTQPNATVSGMIPGQTYQFTWTVTPALPCAPNSSSVTIRDDAPSVGGTTAGANTFCSGTGNNGTITLSGQLGAVLRWESSIDNGTTWQTIVNTATSQPYFNLTQTTQYRAVVQNGSCSFAYSSVSIIVINPAAVTANAGTNQQLCNVTSYTLNGNSPLPATGLWTVTSGQTGVIFSDPTQATATVSGLVPGQTYQFTWTITPTAPCTPNSSSVTITDDAPTIGGTTGGTATVCSGNNNGNITLAGQLGAILRWESSIDNGTTWQTIANTTTTLTYTNLTQSIQYRAVVKNGVCAFAYSTVTAIIVNPPAVTANAGTNQIICNATSYTLSGNNPSPSTGLWTVASGQTGITFSNATQATTTVNGLIPGQIYQFTWTITPTAPCTPNSSTITITDDAPSIGGTTAGTTTFCPGGNISGAVTLSGQLGAVIRWESSIDNGTTWQTIANTTTTQQYINLTQTTQYRAVVQNGVCSFANSTVSTITITPPPVTANAGANKVLCNATSYVLHGNNPSPGTGLWTVTSSQTGITFSDPTQANATVSGMVPGQTYQFTWTITPALPCAPNSSSVTITDDAPSIGGNTAGANTFCSGSNNSGAITLTGQLGAVLRWESSTDNGITWQAIVNTSTSQPYLNLTQTTQYRAVVQNGSCAFAYSSVSIIVINPQAVPANAGTNQQLCNVTSYTLNGNSPSPATGLWTVTSGQTGVIFSDPTQANATVSGLVPGQTYKFTWTITPTAPCSPNSSSVTITDDAPTIGGTTAGTTTVCSGNNSGNITLTGQLGAILRWESSTDNGATWQTIANTSTTLPYANLTQTIQYRAVVQNGICTFANSTVTIVTVNPPAVAANAGTNQELCNATSYVLQGNNPFPATGIWTVTSGQTGVTFSNATQANATVSGLIPGQIYQFTWTITPTAPCSPNSSTVTITIDAPSVGGTTAGATTFCAGSNISGTVTLTGQLGAILRWESSTDNGATWQSIANTSTSQQYLNLTQTTQYRAVVQNGLCTFANSSVTTITINPPVVPANAGANQEVCNVTTYVLNGNTPSPSPSTGLWTVTSGQTGITFSDPTQPNATVSGMVPGQTYQFTWTVTPGAPCSPNSSSVTITDDAPSVGGTTAGANTFCSGSGNSGTITLSGQLGAVIRWESSTNNGTTWQSIANTATSQPYLNLTQTTQYRAVVQNGLCTFANSTVTTIVINPQAVPANAGINQELCNVTSYTLNGNNPSPGTGLWTLASGQTGVIFSDPTQANATVSGLVPGQTYKFTWTITPTAPCTPNSSSVTITDDAPTAGGNTTGTATVCSGNNNGSITLGAQLGNVVRWESSTDNGVTWQAIANTTPTLPYANLAQTTQYRAVVQNGVCTLAYSSVTDIIVNPPAVAANAGTNQVLCNAITYTLQGNNPSPSTGLWTLTSGQTGVTFSNATLANATVSGMIPGQIYQFTWTITPTAPCSPNSSSVTITDDAPSVGGTTAGATAFCTGSNISGTVTLTGQLGAILRWESSTDNGATWQSIANTSTSQQYLNLTQTTQYRAVVQNGVCNFANSSVTTITINPPAVVANAGTNQELCNVTTYLLNGNSASPGTGIWTVTSSQTGVTFSDPTQPNATVSGMVPGQTYQFTWTVTPGAPCSPNSSSVTITDDAPSVGGTTAGANTFCSGSGNSGTITLSGQLGAVIRWESSTNNGTTWQSIANTATSQPYLNLTQTTQYRAVVQNGLCTFANSTVTTIVINPQAVPANAGINQQLCNVTSYTLNGNNPSPATGLWTVTSGQTGVIFSDPTQANATVSGLIPGQTYKFTWTITPTAPCTPNSSSVTITDDAPTIGGTTAGTATVCSGNNNGSITLAGQLGNVVRWESSTDNGITWQAIANTTPTLPYANLAQTTQYRAVVQNGACTLAYSSVTAIIVNPPAVAANAGTNQELCNATTYTLQGNNPSPGAGLWTVTSGQTGVTFSNATQANATVSGLVPGQIYQFTWTITPTAPCSPNSSSVTITNDAPSVGGTTAGATTFCAGSNISGTVTLTGQLGTILRWESSTDNGATWQSIANTSTSQQYLNLTQTTQYRAVVQNGLCTFANSSVTTITINPPVVPANAGANQEVCNVTTYVLNGNTPSPSPSTGLWTLTSNQTGVTFSDPTQPNATVSGMVPGQTYQFTWTVTPGAPCTPNSSSVTITDDAPSVGGTTAGANTFCAGTGNSGTITLSGQLGAVIRWESSTDNGSTWQPIANTATSQPYTNITQTTQYRAVVKNGLCTFANSTVTTIVINPQAVPANAGINQELCNVTSYTLNGNNPSPGTGLWTVTSSQTGVIFSDPTQANATVSGLIPGQTYQFTWTITPTAPCSPNSSSVTITNDAPTAGGNTTGTTTVCSGSNNGSITLAGQLGNVVSWESSTDNGITWQAIANTTPTLPYANLAQTTQYRAVVQNGICTLAYSSVTNIIVNPPAVAANAGTNQKVCNATTYTLQGNNPSPGAGLWTLTSGQTGVTFSNATQANAIVSGMVPGQTYQFTWTITPSAPCSPNSSSVTITDDAPSVGGTTAGANTFCAGSNISGTITLSGQLGAILRWESSTDNGATWQSIANTSTSQQYLNLTQTTQYRAVVQNGICTFANSTVSAIVVDPPAIPANAGTNQELCNATSCVLQGNNPAPSTGLWTLVSGQTGVTFSDPTQPNATVSGLAPGQTYQFTWTVTAGSQCTPNSSSVTITNDAPTLGGATGGGTTYCAGSNISGTISLSGQLGRVLRWESSIDNGSTWQAIGNTTTTQPYLNLGQTTQYRAVIQNGLCNFAYSTVSVIIINPPAVMANAGPDQEVCNVTSYVLQGNNPAPGTGLWTVISGQTGVIFSDATQPTATVSGLVPGQTYQFTWAITAGPSCAPNSSLVTITDDAPTVGGTTSGANVYCAGSPNSGAIILSGQVGRILRWESSTDNGTTWQSIVNTTTTQQYINLLQTTQYRVVVQNGVCSFAYSTVSTIGINAPAVQANAGTNQELCNASFYILQGNNPSPGAGFWTVTSGQTGIVFSDPTKSNATVTGMIPGNTYEFTWTITPGAPCAPNSSTVTITDDKPTVGGITSGDATVCAGSNGSTITLTGQVGNILRWETSTDNGASWQAIVNTSTTQQYVNLIQTTQYRAVVQNGVCNFAYSSVTTITVNQSVPLANAGGNQQLCGATSFTLLGNNPAPFTGVWTQTSGPVTTIVSPNNYQTQVTGLVPGNTYTYLWTIKGLVPCPDSSDPVQIHDLKDVVASFVADKTDGCGPYTVNFTNTSSSLTGVSFLWNFGDGSPTSTAVNPSHDFVPRTDGRDTTYTVSLNIVNNCAQRAPYTVNVTIRPDAPIAYILPQQLIGCSPFTLAVDNYSPGNNKSYTYYLYDGPNLVQQIVTTNKNQVRFNPINVSATKTYSLYMVATGFCGNTGQSNIIPITISVSNVVAQMFIENNANKGCAPFNVNFVNNSIGADTYYYTIYDVNHVVVDRRQGGVSMLPYTFNNPGTYYVTITAMNSCSTAESNPPIRVDVYPPPMPAFTADLTSGCRNVLVTFTNTTPNDANTQAASMLYDWDFGDGSPHANGFTPPPHSYSSKNSPFTVTLTATNSSTGCTNSVSKVNYIIITPPPGAEFIEKPDSVTTIPNYGFAFIDKTAGIPKYWNWNFGDGQVSTLQNPYHTYSDTGLYKVTLTTISNLGCDSTISHYVRITGTPGQVFVPNAFQPDGASIELRTFTAKGSGIKEWHMQIFNNYAQCIWETRKLDDKGAPVDGWDGTYKGSPMPQGVYVWQITARFINGTDWKGNVIKKSVPSVTGVIHLIR